LNFQWKNHSIFKNFYITSPNIMKPSQCTPPHRELPKIPRTQCEVHQFGGSYSYKTKQTTCLYIYIYNFIFIFILFFWRVIGTIPISPKTKKNQENSKTLHVHCVFEITLKWQTYVNILTSMPMILMLMSKCQTWLI